MEKVYLITRNHGKLKAAKSIFDEYNIELASIEKDYPEIQANSSLEIAKYTATQASLDLKKTVIREDHSLFINALGIPGPYTNFIEENIPVKKLLEILKNFNDRTGYFEVATVMVKSDGKIFENVFRVPITFGEKIKVEGKGWNSIIRLKEEKRAITEYPEEDRLHIWNQGYKAIADFIIKS